MPDIDFGQLRALVIDDNDFVRFMVKKYLTEFGFKKVDEAENGMAAVPMLNRYPDIIICDIAMEMMNGLDFLKHLRSQPEGLSKIPVIFLTGSADEQTVKKAIDLDVGAYLLKPVMPEALKRKVTALLTKALTA